MSAELVSCYQPKRIACFSTVCQRRSQGGSIYLLVDIAVATAVSSYIFIAKSTVEIAHIRELYSHVFTARCYAERSYATVCRLSVRLSVCLSVCV